MCAAVYFVLWRGAKPWQHLLVLAMLGAILMWASMRRFRKIPFACSYLPGKANLNVRLGMYGILFLFLCDTGVRIEVAALHAPRGFVILSAILAAAAFWTSWRARRLAASPNEKLQFEELPTGDLLTLDLTQGGGGEVYIDQYAFRAARAGFDCDGPATQIAQDLWSGFRALVKTPGFSAAAIALIAVGIGGNTAIYSLIHGVLTRPAPGVRANGLVSFGVTRDGQPEEPAGNYLEYLAYFYNSQTIQPLAASGFGFFTLALKDGSYELRGQRVTPNYFDTLGVRIVRGRGFTPEEARRLARATRRGCVSCLAEPIPRR